MHPALIDSIIQKTGGLFISYASEDAVFARWLTLKLTSEGYCVWCAEFELLGGESFPSDVGKALKNHSFRCLAIMSQASIAKPNPIKERTLALKFGQERNEEFLIPLVLDQVNLDDQWMTSDLVPIDFSANWASGLKQLIAKLEKVDTPRELTQGKQAAASMFLHQSFVIDEPEQLHSNILTVESIPRILKQFRTSRKISRDERNQLLATWPAYKTENDRTFRSFRTPAPNIVDGLRLTQQGQGSLWGKNAKVDGIFASNIVSNLLRKSLYCKCIERGLVRTSPPNKDSKTSTYIYFPNNFADKNKISYVDYNEKKTWLTPVGEQSYPGSEKFRYHLAPTFQVRQDFDDEYVIRLRNRVFISDLNDQPLSDSESRSRRKQVCKNWWNKKWLKCQLAVLHYLSNDDGMIRVGEADEQICFSGASMRFQVAVSLNDELVKEANNGIEFESLLIDISNETDADK